MSQDMDDGFATALRALLVAQVQNTAKRGGWWPIHPSPWTVRIAAVLVLAAGGGGIAYATGAWTTGPPGSNAITALASPVAATGIGTETIDLGTRPSGATAINITFTCLTVGDFTFEDGASVECGNSDVGRRSATATYTISLAAGKHTTTITAKPSARWRLIATYASVTTTAWGTNASGQTYGVQNQRGTPDLIAVIATNHRNGYVYADQLNAPAPKTIAGALTQNSAPPRTLNVYESDGKTKIGEFIVGR